MFLLGFNLTNMEIMVESLPDCKQWISGQDSSLKFEKACVIEHNS